MRAGRVVRPAARRRRGRARGRVVRARARDDGRDGVPRGGAREPHLRHRRRGDFAHRRGSRADRLVVTTDEKCHVSNRTDNNVLFSSIFRARTRRRPGRPISRPRASLPPARGLRDGGRAHVPDHGRDFPPPRPPRRRRAHVRARGRGEVAGAERHVPAHGRAPPAPRPRARGQPRPPQAGRGVPRASPGPQARPRVLALRPGPDVRRRRGAVRAPRAGGGAGGGGGGRRDRREASRARINRRARPSSSRPLRALPGRSVPQGRRVVPSGRRRPRRRHPRRPPRLRPREERRARDALGGLGGTRLARPSSSSSSSSDDRPRVRRRVGGCAVPDVRVARANASVVSLWRPRGAA